MTAALRRILKSVAEQGLVAARIPDAVRALRPPGGVVLTYHNVVPDGEPPGGDRSLHLPRAEFARHLDALRESHRIVSLEVLLRARGSGGRPRAAITFDDAYRGALTAGLGELADRGLPCTVFAAPGLLGRSSLWWDALSTTAEEGVPDSVRREALTRGRGRDGEVRRWARAGGLTLAPQPEHAAVADEALLREVVATGQVGVGSHGWEHANLVELAGDELDREVRRPLAWLQERFEDSLVPWLSLPYGHASERVTRAALDAGYEGVLTLTGERAPPGRQVREVPRLNVPSGMSPEGLLLRAAGL